jgi:ribosome-binding factor A
MKQDRMSRVNELLRREIGMALFHVIRERELDLAAVTVTHVITSPNLRNARVFVSVLGHEAERDRILSVLKRHRVEMQAIINKNIKMKYTPCLSFALDQSIERGDRVLGVLMKLEEEHPVADGTVEEQTKQAGQQENE